MGDTDDLIREFRQFTAERDWAQFHDPKSLVLALVGEVGELAELFQWLPAGDAQELAGHDPLHTRVGEEIGDVLVYLLALADSLDIDAVAAARSKVEAGRTRFPADEFTGRAPDKAGS